MQKEQPAISSKRARPSDNEEQDEGQTEETRKALAEYANELREVIKKLHNRPLDA
jgi:hypothetical protein